MKSTNPPWLDHAVFYQIYPQSFHDSNGDGIGDLEGIRRKLDYIQSLGCTVVWLNPCFDSPFEDAGYDVRDYRKIAPRYGTRSDLKRLIRDLKQRGMRLCLDFVPGHTSVEHPWFRQSCRPEPNRFTNWYVWTDNVWTGAPGLKTVNAFSNRDGQYVTNFFWFQPALNFGFAHPDPRQPWQLPTDHPDVMAVKHEIRDIMDFWLAMGVDGFRVDMASSLVKGDADGTAMRAFWQETRRWIRKKYPEAALVAEWSNPEAAIPAGFDIDFMIHFNSPAYNSLFRAEPSRSCFPVTDPSTSFFDASGNGDVSVFLDHWMRAWRATRPHGLISIPSGNHDITRLNTDRSVDELKVAFAFLLTLPGVPTLYYGDEIGMRYLRDLTSKEGGFGRTGARTPMQWDRTRNAGFSTAPARNLYLPVDPDQNRPNVRDAEDDPQSLLHHVRRLLTVRRECPALGNRSDFLLLHGRSGHSGLVFLRVKGRRKMLVALNPAGRAARVSLAEAMGSPGENKIGFPLQDALHGRGDNRTLEIPAYGFCVCEWRSAAKAKPTK